MIIKIRFLGETKTEYKNVRVPKDCCLAELRDTKLTGIGYNCLRVNGKPVDPYRLKLLPGDLVTVIDPFPQ